MPKLSQTRVRICKKVPCQMRHYYLYTCEIYLVVRHILSGYMYVENGEKSIKGLGQMQGRLTGGVGIQPHLILRRFFFNCSHMLLCTGYFYMGGGGGWPPLN